MVNKDFTLSNGKRLDILMQMLRSIPDVMIFLINCKQEIILAEGVETTNRNLDIDNLKGKQLREIFDEQSYASLSALVEVALNGTRITHEMTLWDNYYFIKAVPIVEEKTSEVVAGMLIFDNITEDKLNADALKSAKRRAEKSNLAKTEFLAQMSHEIRTPLSTIIGFSEQLTKSGLNEKQKSFVDAIANASDHLLSMINEIITLSQVDAGEVNLEKRPFHVSNVLRQVTKMERLKADKKGIRLHEVCSKKLNRTLYGDDVVLKQILLNLVNNAIKFTEKGSVLVSAEIESQGPDVALVKFRVVDTGIGIPKKKFKVIFDEFTQADPDVSMKLGGSGLGLSIAKKLVAMQGGDITVKSEEGKGSEFTVLLPYEIAERDLDVRSEKRRINSKVLSGTSMLFVDDDSMNRMLADAIFSDWKVDYDIASDGFEALEMARRKNYDVVLMDIRMPGIGGVEVAQKLRKIYKNRKDRYSIIAVTANAIRADINRFMKSGMDDYLLKPFKERDLYDIIVRHLLEDPGFSIEVMEFKFDHESRVEEAASDYDLGELHAFAKQNKAFFNTMIKTFIANASNDLMLLNHHLKNNEWEELGNLAHKMISSYRHLKIDDLAGLLEEIEDMALRDSDFGPIPGKVELLHYQSMKIIEKLENELL